MDHWQEVLLKITAPFEKYAFKPLDDSERVRAYCSSIESFEGDGFFAGRFAPEEQGVLEKMVLETQDSGLVIGFIKAFEASDISALQDIVVADNSPVAALYFARLVNTSDVEPLQKVIEDWGNTFFFRDFAAYVDGADVKSLYDRLLESPVPSCLTALWFAHNYVDVDITAIQQMIVDCNRGDYAALLAATVEGVDIEPLVPMILQSSWYKLETREQRETLVSRLLAAGVDEKLLNKFI